MEAPGESDGEASAPGAMGLGMCSPGGRPHPDQAFRGYGPVSGAHKLVIGSIPATSEGPRAMISLRNSVSSPYPAS